MDAFKMNQFKEEYGTCWTYDEMIGTTLGDFSYLIYYGDPVEELDAEAIKNLLELKRFFITGYKSFLEILASHYKKAEGYGLLEVLEIPSNLKVEDLGEYIEKKELYVMEDTGDYYQRVHLSVPWDQEGGLLLEPAEEGWEIVDF